MLLTDKVMVVTGGNSGIGAAIVRAAAAEGAKVVIDYVAHEDATEKLVDDIKAGGGEATGVEADISKPADLHRLMQAAIDTYGRLDVLVNNAGIETRQSLLDSTEEDYDRVMAINMKSAFFASQAAAKQFITQGEGGLILNISSVHEDWPMPGNIAYCVSKGGMRMLTRTAGVELGEHGIRDGEHRARRRRHPHQRADDQQQGAARQADRRHPAPPRRRAVRHRRRGRLPLLRQGVLHDLDHGRRRRRHHAGQRRAVAASAVRLLPSPAGLGRVEAAGSRQQSVAGRARSRASRGACATLGRQSEPNARFGVPGASA